MKHLFCLGYGYSARALVSCLDPALWQVTGTIRPGSSAEKNENVQRLPFGHFPDEPVTHVLISIPPDHGGDPSFQAYEPWLGRQKALRWTGYLSTTGVYGNRDGAWVDEDTPTLPTGERGQRRLQAELSWQALHKRHTIGLQIFRLAGIYGPGRNQLQALRDGSAKRIIKPGQVFSRIHVDDIAGMLLASITRPNPGRIYNICDDEPAPPQEVVTYAASLLGLEPPPEIPFETAHLGPMARSFFSESKRVSNQRIKSETGYVLRYPTYREGLQALLEFHRAEFQG